ncbi:putative ArCR [uncultured archaeon]|nr:putative ArCR [uncultured archaeon]
MLSIQELGKKLVEAGRLKLGPLCVYGTDEIPKGAMPSYTIDRCIAKAVFAAALFEEMPLIYVAAGQEQCCPGGMVWMGFDEPHPKLKYFVTVGTPDFQGGAAEHLKATAELFEEQRKRAGIVTPPGKYIVIGPCADNIIQDKVRSLILFAGSEQIRNLCGLAQFNSSDPFFKTVIPAGSICSTMITFPAAMAENAPKDSAYVGPTDPTGNPWLPPELMIMGIPIALARQMAADLDESFIGRRARIAYPEKRVSMKPRI